MKNNILLIVLVLISSCGDQQNCKVQFYDKEIGDMYKEEYNLSDRTIVIKYKSNGNIYCIEHYKKNSTTKQGSSVYFYSNGNVKAIRNYVDGIQNGENIYFYDNQVLDEWFRLKIVGEGIPKLNETVRTNDKNGNIDNLLSEYFTVKSSYDTIQLGETYNYEITSITSESTEDIYLLVGNFDDKFNLGKEEKLDTIWFETKCFTPYVYQEVKTTKKGPHIIRGIINNVKHVNELLEKNQYNFQLNYFVK